MSYSLDELGAIEAMAALEVLDGMGKLQELREDGGLASTPGPPLADPSLLPTLTLITHGPLMSSPPLPLRSSMTPLLEIRDEQSGPQDQEDMRQPTGLSGYPPGLNTHSDSSPKAQGSHVLVPINTNTNKNIPMCPLEMTHW